jgi:hypothetical protein
MPKGGVELRIGPKPQSGLRGLGPTAYARAHCAAVITRITRADGGQATGFEEDRGLQPRTTRRRQRAGREHVCYLREINFPRDMGTVYGRGCFLPPAPTPSGVKASYAVTPSSSNTLKAWKSRPDFGLRVLP